MLKPQITIFGEFVDPEFERKYQAEHAAQNYRRMFMICIVTSIVYFLAIIINLLSLGVGVHFYIMFLTRFIVLLVGLSAAYTAWKADFRCYCPTMMMTYMILVGVAESIEIFIVSTTEEFVIDPVAVIIVLMYYVLMPIKLRMAFIPGVFMSVSYLGSILLFVNIEESQIVDLFMFFLLVNIYGTFHMIIFNRINRNEFHALVEQQRLNDLLQQEIAMRQQAEQQLRDLATIDDLTGLHNRRHFMQLFTYEIRRTYSHHNILSLMMIDVDHFKVVNDTYGHMIGDMVLRHVADLLRMCLRDVDIVARFGGEEFIVLLPQTDLQSTSLAAERVRQIIAETPIKLADTMLGVSVSVGVAIRCYSCDSMDALIQAADEALYAAKRLGRNRVAVSDKVHIAHT